jgi:spore coat polysaccharide biosynthesis predicted glycosyltransferase SpsG
LSRILIFAGLYKNGGIGNVLRMATLANFIKLENPNIEIEFLTNAKDNFKSLIEDIGEYQIFATNEISDKKYDVVLFDSVKKEEELLDQLKGISNRIVAFDFFNYLNPNIDTIINLYNHCQEELRHFKGNLYSGVKYAILKDDILNTKVNDSGNNSELSSVLITFGGEDPNKNTLNVLRYIQKTNFNAVVLLGKFNCSKAQIVELFSEKYEILDQVTNIEAYYKSSDIVICGGGTTILECLHLGKPIIAIPQNTFEEDFIRYIDKHVSLFKITDLPTITDLLHSKNKLESLSKSYRIFVDGNGKKRIYNIIKKSLIAS